MRGIDARIRETREKLAVAVQAAGTSLTGLFGVGPIIAAAVIGDVRDVSRFGGRDPFAAYNGTAPIEGPPASAVRVWATNRREIADLLVLVAAAATVTPTDSPIRNGRREATPARTGSSTSRLSGSSAANSR